MEELTAVTNPEQEILTVKEAAQFLGINDMTLRVYKAHGYGPRFCIVGEKKKDKIRYTKSALLEWKEKRKQWK